jgi:hypothetical protein
VTCCLVHCACFLGANGYKSNAGVGQHRQTNNHSQESGIDMTGAGLTEAQYPIENCDENYQVVK